MNKLNEILAGAALLSAIVPNSIQKEAYYMPSILSKKEKMQRKKRNRLQGTSRKINRTN